MRKPASTEPSSSYGRRPWDSPVDVAAAIDRLSEAALYGLPLIDLSPMAIDPTKPSSVRVFGKSLHVLAAGWILSVGWLWLAGLQQALLRDGAVPPDYGIPLLIFGTVSGLVLEACALYTAKLTGRAPSGVLEKREWHHAFWWSLFPNAMLWATVYLMIASAY